MFAYTNIRSSSVNTHQMDVSKPLIIQACLRHPSLPAPWESGCVLQDWTSYLLSYVGYVWKPYRTYSGDWPKWYTTRPSNHGGVYSVAYTLKMESLTRTIFFNLQVPIPFEISYPSGFLFFPCIILETCPDWSHAHPIEPFSRFVRQDSSLPAVKGFSCRWVFGGHLRSENELMRRGH